MRLLIASILLGLVANLLVAWGFAMLVDVCLGVQSSGFAVQAKSNSLWEVSRFERLGSLRVASMRSAGLTGGETSWGNPPETLLSPWTELEVPTQSFSISASPYEYRWVEARGWPRHALQCNGGVDYISGSPRAFINSGIRIGPGWAGTGPFARDRILPIRPVWGGFITNTLTYACGAFLLLVGIRRTRSIRRYRRLRCVACAHQLVEGQIACPECGRKR